MEGHLLESSEASPIKLFNSDVCVKHAVKT